MFQLLNILNSSTQPAAKMEENVDICYTRIYLKDRFRFVSYKSYFAVKNKYSRIPGVFFHTSNN